jgi:hypothetical protein
MTDKVKEALEQEKQRTKDNRVSDITESLQRMEASLERIGSPIEMKPFEVLEFYSEKLEYFEGVSLDRMERRRSTPEGRAAVERENEKALEKYIERPSSVGESRNWYENEYAKAGVILPSMKAEMQAQIRASSEQFLAQQSMLPKAQAGMER